jgi:hypothetical protein
VGAPLALGSAAGAYLAAWLATGARTKAWDYRFLIVVVVLSRFGSRVAMLGKPSSKGEACLELPCLATSWDGLNRVPW